MNNFSKRFPSRLSFFLLACFLDCCSCFGHAAHSVSCPTCLCANLFMVRPPFMTLCALKWVITEGVINMCPPTNKKDLEEKGKWRKEGLLEEGGRE